ncbi:DUF7093 family protein [Halomicrobium urmianum]|uniref:DUF7093 family protein n=1 Tax=Halomicrobium urmianum TaxID=1586233 RepID=UPI001CDA2350|nr:hypothetical protein [Halomicrobium urmianum]
MSLKCSVLGHSFGETEVERDREEQGSEVVITIREVETCERCGTERTVSENKEVTAIETPDDGVVGGPADDADEPADASAATDDGGETAGAESDEAAVDEPTDDGAAEIVDGEPADESGGDGDAEPAVAADAAAEASGSDGDAADPDAAPGGASAADAPDPDQGAEIIDAEDDEPVEPVDDELADPSVGEPEPSDEPEPDPAEADDAVFIDDADDEDDDRDDRAPGEWPDEGDEDDGGDGEWTPDVGTGEPAEGPEIRNSSGVSVTVPEGQFRCPECDYTTPVESSSLRAGDFCPECHRGSLVNEPVPEDGTRKE